MRLATFNILHGRSLIDGRVDNDRLVDACRSLDADVLALQEVDRRQDRSGAVDQTALVAEAVGAADWRFEAAIVGEPGGRWRPATAGETDAEPGYGVGLVSRLPVRSWRVVRLPAAPVPVPLAVPGARRLVWMRDEPRVGVVADIEAPFGVLSIVTTHLSVLPGWNALQLRRLVTGMGRTATPAVLLGDLNLPPPLPGWASGWRPLAARRTFPAANPSLQIDHVLGRGRLPRPTGSDAVLLPVSDHRALVVDLDVVEGRSDLVGHGDGAREKGDPQEGAPDPVELEAHQTAGHGEERAEVQ